MKILKTLPKGDNLQHDGRLLWIVRLAIPAFITISSITVFGGVKSYLSDYLANSSFLVASSVYGVGYVFFSLAPDVLNAVAIGYIARSIIKGHINDRLCTFLVLFCALLVIPLTRYSYKMSKISATAIVEDAAPKIGGPDLAPMDNFYQSEINRLTSDYDQEKKGLEEQYQKKLESIRSPFIARLEAKQGLIEIYERNRKETNTSWTDKKIVQVQEQIAKIESEKNAALVPIIDKKIDVLSDLKNDYNELTLEARKIRLDDRQLVKSDNKEERSKVEEITNVVDRQFGGIAGYAVLIFLALTIVLEVLEHRNGIENEFVFSLFDAGLNPIIEVLGLPFTKAGRNIINSTRRKHSELEEMAEPVANKVKFKLFGTPQKPTPKTPKKSRPGKRQQKKSRAINLLAGLSSASQNNSTNTGGTASTNSKATISNYDSGVTFTAHQSSTKKLSIADLRQRLRMYQKRLAKHTQVKLKHEKAGREVPTRTLNAIKNNADWVQFYEHEIKKAEAEI